MNRVETINNWFDTRLNPVLVKDIRSWLRSRKFMIIYFFALAVIQVFTFFYILASTYSRSQGATLFSILACGLAFILTGILPYLMQERLAEELASRSTELSLISRLTPGQLVRGKIMSGVTVSLLFFSAAAPSFTIAYMLGGIGLDVVVYVVILLLLFTVATMVPAILLPALVGRNKRIRILSILFLGTGITGTTVMGVVVEMGRRGRLFDGEFLPVNIYIGTFILSMMVFFYSAAISKLSFDAANRDTKPRLALTAAVVLNFLLFSQQGAYLSYSMGTGTLLRALAVSLYMFLFGVMFLLDTPDTLSMRLKTSWKGGKWRHLFYPGRGRLFTYILVHMFAFLCIALAMGDREMSVFWGGKSKGPTLEALVMICTGFAFVGGGLLIHHLLGKRFKALKGKKILFAIMLIWMMWGVIFSASAGSGVLPDLFHLACPITALFYVMDRSSLFADRATIVLIGMLVVLVPVLYFMLKYALLDIKEGKRLSKDNRRLRMQEK
ncbi:MAG: hypothetical protein GY765_22030 [bacterium]|nr:hypothetical protein [bacterium]